jgi:hypothetical protein
MKNVAINLPTKLICNIGHQNIVELDPFLISYHTGAYSRQIQFYTPYINALTSNHFTYLNLVYNREAL